MAGNITTAIITAASVLSGVIIAQVVTLLSSIFERKSKDMIFHRDKLEEIADMVHQSEGWCLGILDTCSGQKIHQAKSDIYHRPVVLSNEARRVYVLSLIYFPSLRKESKTLLDVSNKIYILASSQGQLDADKFKIASAQFSASIKSLDKLIVEVAQKNLIR